MRSIATLILPALLCLFVAAGPGAIAQESVHHSSPDLPLLDLEFRGGTVSDYVAAIRKRIGDVNILVMPDAKDVRVPAMELKSVDIASALRLLDGMVEESPGRSVRLVYGWIGDPGRADRRPIHTINARVAGGSRAPAPERNKVLAVGHILASDVPPAALLTAIETALELIAGDHERAQVRFHADTGLIIARGHPEQVSAIESVVDRLWENVESRRHIDGASRDAERAKQDVDELRRTLAAKEGHVAQLVEEVVRHRTRQEMYEKEMEALRHQLEERSQEAMHMRNRVHELELQIATLKAAGP